jgi:hypothetical protein
MKTLETSWKALRDSVNAKGISSRLQWRENNGKYDITIFDGSMCMTASIPITKPRNADQYEFEKDFKSNSNKLLNPTDNGNSPLTRFKITETGWNYQLHGFAFETCKPNSDDLEDHEGNSLDYVTVKCYKENGEECENDQDAAVNCTKTIMDWMPNFDYEILGGILRQQNLPTEDVKVWVIGVPDIPQQFGGSKMFVVNANLKFIGLEEGICVDGRAPKHLQYSPHNTNKIRVIIKHPTGYFHKIHMTFEIFKE